MTYDEALDWVKQHRDQIAEHWKAGMPEANQVVRLHQMLVARAEPGAASLFVVATEAYQSAITRPASCDSIEEMRG